MRRRGSSAWGHWLGYALLGAALAGCGSARSDRLGTRAISDPGGAEDCESTLEFVALGSLPEDHGPVWLQLDQSSQRAVWSFTTGHAASSFHWSQAEGVSELPLDTLAAEWSPPAEPYLLQVQWGSADASVGAGESHAPDGGTGGFRWSEDGAASPLDFVPSAINRDGTVIVGVQADGQLARWTLGGGVEALGIPQAPTSRQLLSAAGDVIVGSAPDESCHRWTAGTGDGDLGLLPGMATCIPVLMSSGGDVLVGVTQASPSSPTRLFRWTLARGLEDLQLGDGATASAWPRAMSTDGRVIAVELDATDGSFSRLARWSEDAGAEEIAPGTNLLPDYVSPLGDVIIGALMNSPLVEFGDMGYLDSFRWTEAGGLERLGMAPLGLALGGKLMVGLNPEGPEIRKFGDLGAGERLVDLLPPGIVPEGWSDPKLRGISEDGGLLFGNALGPDGERQNWLQHLTCPDH